jgi:hypothetical protein
VFQFDADVPLDKLLLASTESELVNLARRAVVPHATPITNAATNLRDTLQHDFESLRLIV